ncbi:MAG TPA: 3-deoxy-manno-octulosonate cytidylyltransferase [Patescibacteria group bacterium]|nr:3-deoxy-manno-octulosonate cytidylyltransferase [Patescibacteria group bacterium]
MKVVCIIPARYHSTRLPNKPLAPIDGKPLIRYVYEQARKARRPQLVLVATDHPLIFDAVREFGGQAVMTDAAHPTGTDRLAEVAAGLTDTDVIINVQGDEPLIPPALIDRLADAFATDEQLQMATVMTTMAEEEYTQPGAVKVVTDRQGYALYFSRSLIPYPRVAEAGVPVYKHIGIYAYRRDFLLQYASMAPTPLEKAESLEQLRALENGYRIKVIETDCRLVGVDTPEDLERVREILNKQAIANEEGEGK